MKKQYDAIILGAGQATPPLAARLAGKEGLRTALIEMSELGEAASTRAARQPRR